MDHDLRQRLLDVLSRGCFFPDAKTLAETMLAIDARKHAENPSQTLAPKRQPIPLAEPLASRAQSPSLEPGAKDANPSPRAAPSKTAPRALASDPSESRPADA